MSIQQEFLNPTEGTTYYKYLGTGERMFGSKKIILHLKKDTRNKEKVKIKNNISF